LEENGPLCEYLVEPTGTLTKCDSSFFGNLALNAIASETFFRGRCVDGPDFELIGICQLLGVVCKASQFQAKFTLREETNNDHFFATAGRAAKKLGQGNKLSQRELRQFGLIPRSD
jgi:hypothetical protein